MREQIRILQSRLPSNGVQNQRRRHRADLSDDDDTQGGRVQRPRETEGLESENDEEEGVDDQDKEGGSGDEEPVLAQKVVKSAAHKYVIMYGPWLRGREETFTYKAESLQVASERTVKQRFATTSSKVQGQAVEVFAILPSDLHAEFEKEYLPRLVCRLSLSIIHFVFLNGPRISYSSGRMR